MHVFALDPRLRRTFRNRPDIGVFTIGTGHRLRFRIGTGTAVAAFEPVDWIHGIHHILARLAGGEDQGYGESQHERQAEAWDRHFLHCIIYLGFRTVGPHMVCHYMIRHYLIHNRKHRSLNPVACI